MEHYFIYGQALKIAKVNASQNRKLCLNLRVMSLPTFIVYRDGKEVNRLTGGKLSINELDDAV